MLMKYLYVPIITFYVAGAGPSHSLAYLRQSKKLLKLEKNCVCDLFFACLNCSNDLNDLNHSICGQKLGNYREISRVLWNF